MSQVLLVGKAAPDRGGIAALLETLTSSELTERHDLRLLNLTRDLVPKQRKLSLMNVRRAVADAWVVFGASRRRDVVHIHSAIGRPAVTLRAGLLGAAARVAGARVILHAHSGALAEQLERSLLARVAARLSLLPAHAVITVAVSGQKALAGYKRPEQLLRIDNGVDLASYERDRRPVTPPRILYAGLLTPRKGVVDLLRASDLLRARGVAHELVLAGGTPTEGVEAEAVVRSVAGSHVRFLGALPHEQMPAVYASASIFCLPSWWEGMPVSILEAMAAGLAVVATRVGAIPEMVEHGSTGLLVPLRDPEALADALQQLVEDPGVCARMGSRARAVAQTHFGVQQMVDALDDVYTRHVAAS